MGNIITLLEDKHLEAQSLLPWYAMGRLEGPDRTRVEAHLVECPECSADLAVERRLAAEWAATPLEADANWLRLRERVVADRAGRAKNSTLARLVALGRPGAGGRRPWMAGVGWALAAAQGIVLVAIAATLRIGQPVASYHALGAAPASAAGNVLVMFNPDTSERRFSDTLAASHARLVDGPTASGAYVLHVSPDERAAVLAQMRARPEVELAQPIDPGVVR